MIQLSDFYGYSMYTISSDTLSVSVMSLGATVTKLAYQGRNVVVSLKTPDDYLQDTSYLGAIVGRYANRIAGGRGLSRRADDARHLSRGGQPAVPRF